ncbi:hypothetical protein CRE_26653 [Caenorhabditis remanei]|uniref:Uncharacterized protein n=1 Tax=Caenorhabditis remanei TaxID=31234 RepID=E3MKS3_CAERE|nr:hypothetical protein CRE_26653 [Caenorhabditis remanei]
MLKLREAYEGSCRVESNTVNLMLGIEARIIQKKVDLVDDAKESEKLLQVYKFHLPFLVVTLFFITMYLGFHTITGRPVPHWVQFMLSGPFHCFGCSSPTSSSL